MLLRIILALLLMVVPASAQFIFGGGGSSGGGSGTVTTLSVATANGFAGTVATATTTPVITLTTSITGSVCSNGTALSACTTTGTGSTVLAASPTITGTLTFPTPFTLGAVSVTSTGAQLNYLSAATGTTGTASTSVVFSTSPTLVTPALGVATATSVAIGGATLGANALAVNGQVTNAGGTITTSQPFTITQTWNASGTTFNGLLINATNTASASVSTLADMQVGGSSVFQVRRNGSVVLAATQGIGMTTADINFTRNGMTVAAGYVYSFSNNVNDVTTVDTAIARNASGVIQFSTSATPNASGAWLAAKGTLTGGTLADQAQVLAITATQPTTPTGEQDAILETITGAGSASQANYARKTLFNAGYTGTSFNAAASFVNLNAGSLSSGVFIGLANTTPSVGAALIVDNGAVATNIFLARDNGSTVFTIADGGAITASGIVTVSNATDSTTTTSGSVQVAGGMAIRKRIFADGLTASAGLQTAVICQSSAGELIADSVACLASSARFKTILGSAEVGAIDKIMKLPIYRWKYNEEGIFNSKDWTRERIGPTAEETAAIDPRLVGYGSDGQIRNISTEQLLSLTIQALQELKADNDNLRATVVRRAANGG